MHPVARAPIPPRRSVEAPPDPTAHGVPAHRLETLTTRCVGKRIGDNEFELLPVTHRDTTVAGVGPVGIEGDGERRRASPVRGCQNFDLRRRYSLRGRRAAPPARSTSEPDRRGGRVGPATVGGDRVPSPRPLLVETLRTISKQTHRTPRPKPTGINTNVSQTVDTSAYDGAELTT